MKTIGALLGLASSRRRRQNIRTLIWMLLFLIGMMGIDAASYIAKRLTHKPELPRDEERAIEANPPNAPNAATVPVAPPGG